MVFTLHDYIHAFWRFTVNWVSSNENGHSIWLPDQEILCKIRKYDSRYKHAILATALTSHHTINWINDIVYNESLVVCVTRNRKTITANKKTMYVNFYLIEETPILLQEILTKTEYYQKVWDENQSTNQLINQSSDHCLGIEKERLIAAQLHLPLKGIGFILRIVEQKLGC